MFAFEEQAHPEVIIAMRQTITNMLGTLPPHYFRVVISTEAANLAQVRRFRGRRRGCLAGWRDAEGDRGAVPADAGSLGAAEGRRGAKAWLPCASPWASNPPHGLAMRRGLSTWLFVPSSPPFAPLDGSYAGCL
jgi:hypothetical protein